MSKDKVETAEHDEQQEEFVIADLDAHQDVKGGALEIKATDVTLKRGVID